MRKGYDASLVFDEDGEIFAISTGSDACSEHEWGSDPLQRMLCEGFVGRGSGKDEEIIQALRDGASPAGLFPDLLGQKRINQNLHRIRLSEGVDARSKRPAAVLWVSTTNDEMSVNHRELAVWGDDEQVGAWGQDGFAFKVIGQELVENLKKFARALMDGEGCFAGAFLKEESRGWLSGVVVALPAKFTPQDLEGVKKEQERYESAMLLRSRSRVEELHALVHAAREKAEQDKKSTRHLRLPGYIWPIWRDNEVGGEVRYGLNPDCGTQAKFRGPYTFEQLSDWILAEKKYPLEPAQGA